MMGSPLAPLTLFVSGSVDPEELPARSRVSLGLQIQGSFATHGLWAKTPFDPSPPTEEEASAPRLMDPESVSCVNLVLDLAARVHRAVALINVEAPGLSQPDVRRWVGPNTLLPLLVRFDGATLSGAPEFDPERVRRFVAGP